MVAEARRRHPGTPGVVCDARALPVRLGSLAGVWASKSLQHVPRAELPMVLAGPHPADHLHLARRRCWQLGDVRAGGRQESSIYQHDFP